MNSHEPQDSKVLFGGPIDALCWSPGGPPTASLHVFGITTDLRVVHLVGKGNSPVFSAEWFPATTKGGGLTLNKGSLSAIVGTNPIDMFAISQLGNLLHKAYTGLDWADWVDLGQTSYGGGLVGATIASVLEGNVLHVFAITASGYLLHRFWMSPTGWSEWQNMGTTSEGGGLAGCSIIAGSCTTNLDLVTISAQADMLHQSWNGSEWSGWQNLGTTNLFGGLADSAMIGACGGTQWMEIFTLTPTGNMLRRMGSYGNWEDWNPDLGPMPVDGGPAGPVAGVAGDEPWINALAVTKGGGAVVKEVGNYTLAWRLIVTNP